MVLSPSLRPRQERGLEDHRALAELEPDPKEMPAHSPMRLPLDCETQAGKQATRVQSSALPLICPMVLGSSQALHLPTWKAESDSLGVYAVYGHSQGWEWSFPDALGMPAQGQRARSRSPPHLASRPLAPASLRGSGSAIRAPGLRWRLVIPETRLAARGCLGNLAPALA